MDLNRDLLRRIRIKETDMSRVGVSALERKTIIKRLLDEAAEAEASDVRTLPGLRDIWMLIIRVLRGH